MKEMCASLGKVHEFLLALKKAGFDSHLIQQIINSKDNQLAEKMLAAVGSRPILQSYGNGIKYTFLVDYNLSVEEMVEMCNFDWASCPSTSDYFPIPENKIGKKEIISCKLINFKEVVDIKESAKKIEKTGLRPATFHEGLAFARNHPELQKELPILVIGSPWTSPDSKIYFLILCAIGTSRGISLLSSEGNVSDLSNILVTYN